jgi:hypothetical protein
MLDAYRRWRERRREAAWENEALYANRELESAEEAPNHYDAAYHYKRFLDIVKHSKFSDRYDIQTAKDILLDKIEHRIDEHAPTESLERILGPMKGYRPFSEILTGTGISTEEILTHHGRRRQERRDAAKRKLLEPLEQQKQLRTHELAQILRAAREYDLTPDERASLQGITLGTLANAGRVDPARLASDEMLPTYRALKREALAYGATPEQFDAACAATERRLDAFIQHLEKIQDQFYLAAATHAEQGRPQMLEHARKFVQLSRAYAIALDEDERSITDALREIDRLYTAAAKPKDAQ